MTVEVVDGKLIVHESKQDICSSKPKLDLVRMNLVAWAFPDRCSITETTTVCQNGSKIFALSDSTQKILNFISLSKGNKLRISIEHDTGMSCFEANVRVVKR